MLAQPGRKIDELHKDLDALQGGQTLRVLQRQLEDLHKMLQVPQTGPPGRTITAPLKGEHRGGTPLKRLPFLCFLFFFRAVFPKKTVMKTLQTGPIAATAGFGASCCTFWHKEGSVGHDFGDFR